MTQFAISDRYLSAFPEKVLEYPASEIARDPSIKLPKKFDWREKNVVTPVENQESVGRLFKKKSQNTLNGCIVRYLYNGNDIKTGSVLRVYWFTGKESPDRLNFPAFLSVHKLVCLFLGKDCSSVWFPAETSCLRPCTGDLPVLASCDLAPVPAVWRLLGVQRGWDHRICLCAAGPPSATAECAAGHRLLI